MPKRRSQPVSKASWSQDQLRRGFNLVADGKPIREAARSCGVPFSTLQERIKNKNSNKPQLGRNTVFTREQENEMATQVKFLGKIFYGCTSLQIRKMAYEYAVKNNIKHNFNDTFELAGKDWLKGFIKRNHLSIRKAQGMSLNRATAFNKNEVGMFFKLLTELMDKYKFLPRNIWNVDETGISAVQDPGKIVAEKGQKRVGSITSGERGKTVTAVCAVNATGVYVPPMLIYPRQRHSSALETDGPRGAVYRCSKNGWINEDLFVDWLKHFAEFTKPSENEPILLVLDNHASHISLRAYEFCKGNNIVMLSLPPHGSHRIQPLDVSVYGPLKAAYKQECNLFIKNQLGKKITQNDLASLFRKAFQKIATIPKAEAGFAATGIYPLNPDVFTDEDFVAAEILNSNEVVVSTEEIRDRDNKTPEAQIILDESITHDPPTHCQTILSKSPSLIDVIEPVSTNNTPIISAFEQPTNIYTNPIPSTSGSGNTITVRDLLPLPSKSMEKTKNILSRKQHASVLTGTPNKQALIEKENRKILKEKKLKIKPEKETIKRKGKSIEVKKAKRRVLQDKNKRNDSTSDSEIEMTDLREDEDTDADDDYENKCIICDDYGQNNELWYRCVLCGLWAHAECSGCDSPEGYICDLCHNKP
uniref:Ig-like domain-containing protein n=1 Tax=Heliothis virescens TaxID=7102 RepID=A0A2A4J4D1_HELVI